MNLKALAMKTALQEKYTLSPAAVMSFNFDSEGDIKKSGAFLKRLTMLTPVLDEMYECQHKILTTLSEMPVIYKLGFNKHAFNALAPHYGKLDKNIKDFKRVLKKGASFPEVVEYFKEADALLDVNVYGMMKEDFEVFTSTVETRMAQTVLDHPDFTSWDTTDVDWETVNQRYKETK